MKLLGILLFSILLFFNESVNGQHLLNGEISDERGIAIPYAKIYVKNSAELRTIADINGYFEMRLFQGEYFLVITALGYETIDAYVAITEFDVTKGYQLLPTAIQDIEDIDVSAKKSNPGRDIMLEVVKKRSQELNSTNLR